MIKRLRYILSFSMVLLLFAPSIIKLEHHHEHFVCKAKNEKHIHEHHEKCQVCNLEFSVFSVDKDELLSTPAEQTDNIIQPCYGFFLSVFSNYSFLLRAPPVFANSILSV